MRKSKRSVVPAAVVDLALLREAGMIAATVARGLGISQDSARSIEDELIEFLRKKRRLLLFDTVKHLPVAATLLGDLRHAAPGLTVLVTGRAAPPNERARGADRAACRASGRA